MILITGATGFIGTNLVQQLSERGETVRILRRRSSNMLGLENLPIDEHVGDVLDPEAVRRAMQGGAHVYHLAGAVNLGPFAAERLRDIHVKGTEIVAQAALDEGVEKLVYTSSSVTIGYKRGDEPATESDGLSLAHIGLPYIATKLEAEQLVLQLCRKGLPAVIVNPGYIFGPWDKAPKLNQLLIMAAQGKLNFYFGGGLSVVDVTDVARGHMLAMEHGRVGERYILSHRNLTYYDFFSQLNAHHGRKPPRFKLPFAMLYTAGLFAGTAGRVFRFNPQLSTGVAQLYRMNHYLDSGKAKRELHYMPTPLDEALERTFHWLREYRFTSTE